MKYYNLPLLKKYHQSLQSSFSKMPLLSTFQDFLNLCNDLIYFKLLKMHHFLKNIFFFLKIELHHLLK